MSSFFLKDIMNLIVPPRVARATIVGDTAAQILAAATQGQFNSIDGTTPIVKDLDGATHKIQVQAIVCTPKGAIDENSVLEIMIEAGQALSAATAQTGTLLGGAGTTTTRGVYFVRPNAAGLVDFRITLAAADTAKVTLRHRGWCSTTASVIIA